MPSAWTRSSTRGYPRVLERIEALGGKPACTAHDIIASLRSENASLKQQRRQANDAAAAMLLRMRDIERRSGRDVERARREALRPNPNRIEGKVVSFPGVEIE